MIWHYNLRILFEEVCKFPSGLNLALEKDFQIWEVALWGEK